MVKEKSRILSNNIVYMTDDHNKSVDISKMSKEELIKLVQQKDKKIRKQRKKLKAEKPKPVIKNKRPVEIIKRDDTEYGVNEFKNGMKGYARWFFVNIVDNADPLAQLTGSRPKVKAKLLQVLEEMKGFKLVESITLTLEKVEGLDANVEVVLRALKSMDRELGLYYSRC